MEFPSLHMQLMYCYDHINLVYSMAFNVNIIYLNLLICKVHHPSPTAGILGQIVANIDSNLAPPQEIKKRKTFYGVIIE
jgi:hypothetical protein